MQWSDFKFNKQIFSAIEELGFETPTPIQEKCIPLIHGGQQVIGIAPTGTGKTAAYLLPLLMKIKFASGESPRALILVPAKELVLQVEETVLQLSKYLDVRTLAVYGGVGPKIQKEALARGTDIIVATPGRFMELYLSGDLKTKSIHTLVIDEADRMLDMGFRPQLRKLFEVIPSKRQNLLFSATFSAKVETLSQEFLTFPIKAEVQPQGTPADTVKQELYAVPNIKTKISFLSYLLEDQNFSRVIIFALTKKMADNIIQFIDRKKLGPARVIHSNKDQNSRIRSMQDFKEGKLRILVSTDVTARGIDVDRVSHVINVDVPRAPEQYVHRIGRTGRASIAGTAVTFATEAELYYIQKIEELIRQKIERLPLPKAVEVFDTPAEEAKEMARARDAQRRRDDPSFKGAFHEKTRK